MSPTVIPVRELGLIGWLAAALFALLAIASYSPADPSFSFTGTGAEVSNLVGRSGAWFADVMLYLFGLPAWLMPVAFTLSGVRLIRHRDEPVHWPLVAWRTGGWLAVLLASCVLLHMHFVASAALPAGLGGIFGRGLVDLGVPVLAPVGLTLLALILLMVGAQGALGFSWLRVIEETGRRVHWLTGIFLELLERRETVREARREALDTAEHARESRREKLQEGRKQRATKKVPEIKPPPAGVGRKTARQQRLFDTRTTGELPDLDLLDEPRPEDGGGYSEASLGKISQLLESKLRDFGVEAEVVSVLPGPVVTRFELQPAPGVKVQKISSLAKDLARSLAVISVRIVEVIPNKPYVGIEIPNEDRQVVRLKEILGSPAFQESRSSVTLALGKDISGQPIVADVARMPHLLVAGTTGSGKSVGVNAMLLSLLYKSTPEEVRLILVDPKMLELSVYEGIPHLLAPVVTDMKDAAQALNWCVAEMDRRYRLMASLGVRNLVGYNRQVQDAAKQGNPIADPLWRADNGAEAPALTRLPVIVVVIDEFADMMMIVGKKVETLIARIAQKARAAGIHLVLATQRPSVDVITGLIKANIPTRIAFQVSSKIDSRTILDQSGAEQLLGHGDMLYLPPGSGIPVRVHGAFVSDEEVHRVVSDWKLRGEPDYSIDILSSVGDEAGFGFETGGAKQDDALYDEAVAFVIESRRPSISSVQRKLRIGYNRAARLIEAMEEAGVVSAMNTNGSREVLYRNAIDTGRDAFAILVAGSLLLGAVSGSVVAYAASGTPATADHAPESDEAIARGLPYGSEADRETLATRLAALAVYSAAFTQTVYGARGEVLEVSEGYVRLQRPQFKWVVEAPYPQTIVTEGDRLKLYDPDLEQLTIRPLSEALEDTPVSLLTRDDVVIGDAFGIVRISDAGGETYLIDPRSPDTLYRQIQLHFQSRGSANMALVGLDILDHLGQRTEIRLRPEANVASIPAGEFALEVPPGTDVIGG